MTENEMVSKMVSKGYSKEHQQFWSAVKHHFCVCKSCLEWVEVGAQNSGVCSDCKLDRGIELEIIPLPEDNVLVNFTLYPNTSVVVVSETTQSYMSGLSVLQLSRFTQAIKSEIDRFINDSQSPTEICSHCSEERDFHQMKIIQTLEGLKAFCSIGCLKIWEERK